jgi:hypothetical protein
VQFSRQQIASQRAFPCPGRILITLALSNFLRFALNGSLSVVLIFGTPVPPIVSFVDLWHAGSHRMVQVMERQMIISSSQLIAAES